eukprot:CAMPEP_0178395676 /NCGR_PEP_ID=MMETSP0689_2-20121128/13341_1 /TAXON_ID=160604 /ORGANISM="Amphidinium massartii, Strain CS-259" /LENGTH=343 /DNA_ID=CAMNT_0020016337 /DNA_START=164 /DNA_END=1195 /DNA_ORIENTATION=+
MSSGGRHGRGRAAAFSRVQRRAQEPTPSRRRLLVTSVLTAAGGLALSARRVAAAVPAARPLESVTAEVLPPWGAALSGALQGVAQNVAKQLVLHPFDTIKTRVQVRKEGDSDGALFSDLYRGLLPTLIGGTPGSATFFAAKEAAVSFLISKGAAGPVPTLGGVVAGVLAAKAVRTPFDVAETRAMATSGTTKKEKASGDDEMLQWDGSLAAAREVYRSEGLRGLYRGYGANVAYKLPADAAKFLAYEALRAGGADKALSPAVAGAGATLMASAVTTPLDVVRTRVLVGSTESGPVETFQKLAKEDPQKLWSGLSWRLIRGVVAGAIQFSVLESTKSAVQGLAK